MQDAQAIYNRLEERKEEAKKIKLALKQAYEADESYMEAHEAVKVAAGKRRQIKLRINESFPHEIQKLEDLQIDIASDREMLNDIILSRVMKGETVEILDKYQQLCLPIFEVRLAPEE